MMRWFSAFALILYLSLLATPQQTGVQALHLTPLADSQLQAINPLAGQASLITVQDSSDDSDTSLQLVINKPLLRLHLKGSSLPAPIALAQPTVTHPVRAPPLYS